MAINDNNNPFGGKWDNLKDMYEDLLKLQKQHSRELASYQTDLNDKALERKKAEEERLLEDLERQFVDLRSKGIRLTAKQEAKIIKQQQKQRETTEKINQLRSAAKEDGSSKALMERTGDYIKSLGIQFTANLKNNFANLGNTIKATVSSAVKDIGKMVGNEINKAMSTYAQYQTGINARLQSTGKDFKSIEKSLSQVAYSPLLNSEELYSNLSKLVAEGIVSNVEQRAFLMTIKDNIATTFDANNASLRRIIRLQQQDSTASRLGMEAFMTRYMNTLVQNTEYLTTTFDNVQSALLEASSLMNMRGANEFEYQVQKWLGAMTGLGLNENTSNSIAQALGYLGSGNIESLLSSNIGNLILMASNRTGLSVGEMLKEGLEGGTTNKLLSSVVEFVQDIWNNSKDNNVVLSQLSNTFGLTVSDIRAIANMSEEVKNSLVQTNLTTSQMYGELGYQFDQMQSRMSIATLMENAFKNFGFQTGATMASNPATYALWKIADMIQTTTGGINIPSAYVLGTGVNLNTTIDQMLKLGLVGYSTLKNIGGLQQAISSLGSGATLLSAMGISEGSSVISRGASLSTTTSGFTTSQSAYMTNPNEGAYSQSANMMMKEQQQAATQENTNKPTVDLETINTNMINKLDVIINYLGRDGIKLDTFTLEKIEGFTTK